MSGTRNILPTNVRPLHYELAITPCLDSFTFIGEVMIELAVKDARCYDVTLNAAELVVLEAEVSYDSKATFSVIDLSTSTVFSVDAANERMTITLPRLPPANNIFLKLIYTGSINDKMHGFYRSAYTVGGMCAFMGTTQFEPADARRALPCWDEPELKATFTVTLNVPDGMMALSNTEEVARRAVIVNVASKGTESRVAVCFAKTPIMSTYLLAWTIGHFECIERRIPKVHKPEAVDMSLSVQEREQRETTLVRVITTEGKIDNGRFALDVACRVLPLYEEFFGSNYILSKCDLIAIPDFSAGAMENWGLITYRETALLCNEESSVKSKHYVALVVAHELAHQWFGNLVTMQWWKELWLNESFARWVQYWAVDVLFPQWDIFTRFVCLDMSGAFNLDAMESSHPVEVDVTNAQEIVEIFDAISYNKGGSILRMVVEYIGVECFFSGIKKYLHHFQFRNASTVELWEFLSEASGKPLGELLHAWTAVQGYPYLTASRTSETKVTLKQARFVTKRSVATQKTIWSIPLLYRASADRHDDVSCTVVMHEEDVLDVKVNERWILLNAKRACFCRILYDNEMLKGLCDAVAIGLITSNIERLGLVSDYHAFAQGGYVSTETVMFQLLPSFKDETDYIVWHSVAAFECDVRRSIINTCGNESVLLKYNAYCRDLYRPALDRIGVVACSAMDDSRSYREGQLRALLLSRLCAAKDRECIDHVMRNLWPVFEAKGADGAKHIPADLHNCVLSTAVSECESRECYDIMKTMCSTTDATFRECCLAALGCSTSAELLRDAVEFSLSNEVRPQDCMFIVSSVASNRHGTDAFIDDFLGNWDTIWKRIPPLIMGRCLKFIQHLPAIQCVISRCQEFFQTIPQCHRAAVERSYSQGLEALTISAEWVLRDGKGVVAALESY